MGVEVRAQEMSKETHVAKELGDAMDDVIYDENVDYDSLEQHTYADSSEAVFYTCPICGGEYLASFIIEHDGQTMCIDCWNERYGD